MKTNQLNCDSDNCMLCMPEDRLREFTLWLLGHWLEAPQVLRLSISPESLLKDFELYEKILDAKADEEWALVENPTNA